MAATKLDMGAAWSSATGLIAQNKDTVSAIVGLFFFLPYFAVSLLVPEAAAPPPPEAVPGARPDAATQAALEQLTQTYADNWPVLLSVTLIQFVGSLALLALLGNPDSPTVGQALKRGLAAAPSYFAAQVMSALFVAVVLGVPLGLISFIAPGLTVAAAVAVLMVAAIYLFVKFSLVAPVIAIEGTRNPLRALVRSWQLTKGNSLRIATFILLIFITIGIVTVLVTMVFTLIFALFDAGIANIGNALVSSLTNTALGVIFVLVLAAVHGQLAGPSPDQLAGTFE